jgi:hypothetical protein
MSRLISSQYLRLVSRKVLRIRWMMQTPAVNLKIKSAATDAEHEGMLAPLAACGSLAS